MSEGKGTERAGALRSDDVGGDAVVNARGDGRERGMLQERGAGRRQHRVPGEGVEDEQQREEDPDRHVYLFFGAGGQGTEEDPVRRAERVDRHQRRVRRLQPQQQLPEVDYPAAKPLRSTCGGGQRSGRGTTAVASGQEGPLRDHGRGASADDGRGGPPGRRGGRGGGLVVGEGQRLDQQGRRPR